MPRYAVNTSILFTELPVLERPAAARQAGFGAIEFWWPFDEAVPADSAVDAFVAAIQPRVTGAIRLKLFKGDCRVAGRRSPFAPEVASSSSPAADARAARPADITIHS